MMDRREFLAGVGAAIAAGAAGVRVLSAEEARPPGWGVIGLSWNGEEVDGSPLFGTGRVSSPGRTVEQDLRKGAVRGRPGWYELWLRSVRGYRQA